MQLHTAVLALLHLKHIVWNSAVAKRFMALHTVVLDLIRLKLVLVLNSACGEGVYAPKYSSDSLT